MDNTLKIAALSDIHVKESSRGAYSELFKEVSEKADILALAGDLCDLGHAKEAELLAEDLRSLSIPAVAVLGNHDYESNQVEQVSETLISAGLKLLDPEPFEYKGVGFAGVKGFGGGFGNKALGAFGEQIYKDFVQLTLSEILSLENQLRKIESEKKVVLMHYSPIPETLVGEPLEISPFMGSSRFLEPIENFDVKAVFHGHAHYGSPKGSTPKGIPVYNVAYPLMLKTNPKQPYIVIEV